MLKKTIKFVDYDGNPREEEFYFNLSKAEVTLMELSVTGGMGSLLTKIIKTKDVKQLSEIFTEIIMKSYGEKSLDGRQFMKSEEISNNFRQTEAFSELFMELITDANAAANFINAILPEIPKEAREKLEKEQKELLMLNDPPSDDKNEKK